MSVIKQFNGLGGTNATRESLIALRDKAPKNSQVYKRIDKLLKTYPDAPDFDLELENPIPETTPLATKKKGEELQYFQDNIKVASINKYGVVTWHKRGIPTKERTKIRKAANVIGLACPAPEDFSGMLHGIDMETENHEEIYGLGKAVSPEAIYDMVTKRMLDLIEKANKEDYERAWNDEGYLIAYNFATKKAYRGINSFMLMPLFGTLDNPYYLTFNQIVEKGGKLKKGSKGHEVVYFSRTEKEYSDAEIEKINKSAGSEVAKKGDKKEFYFLKYYNVFSGSDIEGIDFDLDNFDLQGKVSSDVKAGENETIAIAEKIVENYPKPSPKIEFTGNKAFFSPAKDLVSLPPIDKFKSAQDFYRTYFHELSHSTGHENRLKRDFSGGFGSKEYAFEELTAEFGAVFLSAQAGIMFYTNKNHAGYLKGWNEVLVPQLKKDNRFLMRASSAAQKAADFILQPDQDGVFKFLKKEVKKTVKKPAAKPVAKVQKKTKETVKKATPKIKTIEKPAVKPIPKDQKKTTKAEIIGYAIVDNIDGSIVASKKTLSELESVYQKLDVFIDDMPVLVYEIQRKKDKNVLGDKINVNWNKTKNSEPKGYAIKPKSTSIKTAVQDVLTLAKFKNEKELPASIVYNHFSEAKNDEAERQGEFSKFESNVLENSSSLLYDYDFDYITPLGVEFVTAVNNRLESLKNQKNNLALFDGLKSPAIPEIIYTPGPEFQTIENNPIPVPAIEPKEEKVNVPLNSKYKTAADRLRDNSKPKQLYYLNGDIAKFLGKIEIKPVQSLVVTLDSAEGGGKTHTFYQWANEFYLAGYNPIIWSLEEHAESSLSTDKAKEYFGSNWDKIVIESEKSGESKEATYQRILDSIKDFDVIFIDSWSKLVELNPKANSDQDFRKAYDGKLFFIIYQRTSSGEIRGGSKGAFDGDIILKVEVDRDDFRNNYIYNHKNRYNNYMPISELKYSPFYRKLITDEEPEEELFFTDEIERI